MSKLKCGVCIKFQSSIERRRNYSDKWITGADSICTSNIKDHVKTEHKHTMILLKKEQFQKEKVPLLMLQSLDYYMSSQKMIMLSFESNLLCSNREDRIPQIFGLVLT